MSQSSDNVRTGGEGSDRRGPVFEPCYLNFSIIQEREKTRKKSFRRPKFCGGGGGLGGSDIFRSLRHFFFGWLPLVNTWTHFPRIYCVTL